MDGKEGRKKEGRKEGRKERIQNGTKERAVAVEGAAATR